MSQLDPGSIPPAIPVPTQALAYSTPLPYRRPGIVTAIGVMAIVVGCLSVMANLGTGMTAWGFLMLSRVTARMSRTMPVAAATPATPAAPATPLSGGEVGAAVNTVSSMLALDGPHDRELDRMLRLHGREILGGDEDAPLTGAATREAITSSRKFAKGGSQPAQFVTEEGTVDVYADHAVFTSADGATTVRTSAKNRLDSMSTGGLQSSTAFSMSAGTAPAAPASSTLTPAQVNSVVAAVKSAASTTPLNAAQIQSLRTELSKPNQSLVMVSNGTQVPAAFAQPGGQVTIYFNTGSMLVLGPAGHVISSGPPPMPKFNINPGVAGLVIIEAFLSAALAIYLLVVGVIVLRGSFIGPRLLRIYAWAKIPLAILAGVGVGTLMYQLYAGMSSMPGYAGANAASFAPIGIIYGVVLGVLGVAFPIGVLIALRSRTVRGYFNAVVSGT
ncbi:MAG TPA: hypothetical protein VGI81_09035 [Tepidisphaeraceae bacterium]|jgi:hypothetical protein